jgi:hypothetical protein
MSLPDCPFAHQNDCPIARLPIKTIADCPIARLPIKTIADCPIARLPDCPSKRLSIARLPMRIADCPYPIEQSRLPIADCSAIADCRFADCR